MKLEDFVAISIVVALIGAGVIAMSFHQVGTGERGVLRTWGEVEMKSYNEGMYMKNIFSQDFYNMDIKIQKRESSASSASKDLQSIQTIIALNFHIDPDEAPRMYKEIGTLELIESTIIDPAVQEACKAATAMFTAEELVTKRPLVKEQIKQELSSRLSNYGINVKELSIVDFSFSPQFDEAIEAKVTAEQNAMREKWELEKFRIQQQKKVEQAEAEAKAIMLNAEANANATIMIGKAESEVLRMKNEQLSNILIENLKYSTWDGKLPQFVGTQALPIIDLGNNMNNSGN